MLCRTLSDLGTAGYPKEYYLTWPESLPGLDGYWERGRLARKHGVTTREDFLSLVHRVGTTPNGVFGAKLLWRYVPLILANFREMPQFAGMTNAQIFGEAFPGLKVVNLTRRDRLRQAISWLRASYDEVWWVLDSDSARPARRPEYSFESIAEGIGLIAEGEKAWRDLYAELGVRPFEVVYEDLLTTEGLGAAVRGVLRHLELDDDVDVPEVRTQRLADSLNDEWVERFFADLAEASKANLAAPGSV